MPSVAACVVAALAFAAHVAGNNAKCIFEGRGTDELTVARVASGRDFNATLQSSSTPAFMLLELINGTSWLNLGGDLSSFSLVLGSPPASSSDMTLEQAVAIAKQKWKQKGLILDVTPASEASTAWNIAKSANESFVWISHSREEVEGTVFPYPVNVVWNKAFALDTVVSRVQSEGAFSTATDAAYVRGLLDRVYRGRENDRDIRFLRMNLEKVALGDAAHKHAFTELFLQSLLHASETIERDKRQREGFALLPDLRDQGSMYSQDEIRSLSRIIEARKDECVLITVRAAIMAKTESIDSFRKLLEEFPNVFVVAHAEEYDDVSASALSAAFSPLPRDRVIVDIPRSFEAPAEDHSDKDRPSIPRPQIPVESNSAARARLQQCALIVAALLVAVMS